MEMSYSIISIMVTVYVNSEVAGCNRCMESKGLLSAYLLSTALA